MIKTLNGRAEERNNECLCGVSKGASFWTVYIQFFNIYLRKQPYYGLDFHYRKSVFFQSVLFFMNNLRDIYL